MIQLMIPFKVHQEAIPIVTEAIQKFIGEIRQYEPDTLLYKSFQQHEDQTIFIHLMTFMDKAAQEKHQKSVYCKEFVETVYPLCTELPKAYLYDEITISPSLTLA